MAVRVEKKGGVWTVVHSRAEARNAMDPASADALVSAFQEFDSDPNAKVAVLWGEGGAFCAGWDLKYGASRPLPDRSIALHAWRLAVDHPTLGERVELCCPPPRTRWWPSR